MTERRPGITILIPTSPIPSCPDTSLLEATLASWKAQLPDADVLIAADGWHDGACSEEAYQEYLRVLGARVIGERARLERMDPRFRMLTSTEWLHEANLTRLALPLVQTDLVLFVEHDWTLVGPPVPWPALAEAVRYGTANMVRLSWEPAIPEAWYHLYLEPDTTWTVEGVPLLRTVQWSTRPSLVRTDWFAEIHDRYFADSARSFSEAVLHAVLWNGYQDGGEEWWNEWRLWTYAPDGDLQRIEHTDGRGSAPTRPVTVAYPGETPYGAPAPVVDAPQ